MITLSSHHPITKQLIEAIDQHNGSISFSEFMEIALYSSDGYYNSHLPKIGKTGDFITAPEISPYFARCLARQCQEINLSSIMEIGAGPGTLAVQLLKELQPERYYFFEISEYFKAEQQQLIQAKLPHLYERCIWLEEFPEHFKGVVIANEWLDALPVERFRVTEEGICSLNVGYQKNNFCWVENKTFKTWMRAAAGMTDLSIGYTSEFCPSAEEWLLKLSHSIEQGIVLLIDYGYPRDEYYHPQRTDGTLKCFYHHKHHNDPFFKPGEQDITAHVDFTHIAECATAAGFTVSGFTTQAWFLFNCGLAEEPEIRPHEIERLTNPAEMGEIYKVMALTKHYPSPLRGFSYKDMSYRL